MGHLIAKDTDPVPVKVMERRGSPQALFNSKENQFTRAPTWPEFRVSLKRNSICWGMMNLCACPQRHLGAQGDCFRKDDSIAELAAPPCVNSGQHSYFNPTVKGINLWSPWIPSGPTLNRLYHDCLPNEIDPLAPSYQSTYSTTNQTFPWETVVWEVWGVKGRGRIVVWT